MTQFVPGTEPEETLVETRVGECTSVVVYNPNVFDLSIEVDEEPPEPKIFELPENQTAFVELVRMHTYMRPHGSKTERKFIRDYIKPLGDKVKIDKFGNRMVRIGTAPVLWSCHVDTVHHKKGHAQIGYDGDEIGVAASDNTASCLGADDTAGVWLMLELIKAGKEGLYIFHRGEEVGCLGSKYIALKTPEVLEGIKFAIALDRKGTKDVITRQRGTRTCSNEFAQSLSSELGMGYAPEPTGIYTDTAEYTKLVGECTNISVGYRNAHQRTERLDCTHIFKLRDALLKLDYSKLVEKRKPGEVETYHYSGGHNRGGFTRDYDDDYNHGYYGTNTHRTTGGSWVNGVWRPDRDTSYNGHSSGLSWLERQKLREQQELDRRANRLAKGGENPYNDPKNAGKAYGEVDDDDDDDDDAQEHGGGPYDFDRMVALVKANPEAVADILEQYGLDARQLASEILDAVGICNH